MLMALLSAIDAGFIFFDLFSFLRQNETMKSIFVRVSFGLFLFQFLSELMDVSFTDMGVQLWEHLKVLETVGFANVRLKILGMV